MPTHLRRAQLDTLRISVCAAALLLAVPAALAGPREGQVTGDHLRTLAREAGPAPAAGPSPGETFEAAQALLAKVQEADAILGRADGARLAIFGAAPPADDEKSRLLDAAHALIGHAWSAAETLDRAVERSDRAAPMGDEGADGLEAQIEQALHTRQVVLPLRAAQAALVLAALEGDPARRTRLLALAADLAGSVEPVSPWAEAQAPLIRGCAAMLLGAHEAALQDFALAIGAVRGPEASRDGPSLADDVEAQAALGATISTQALKGPVAARAVLAKAAERAPFVREGRRDPALALLAAEVNWRLCSAEAMAARDEARRRSAVNAGYERFASLLAPGATSAPPGALRALVLARVARLSSGPLAPWTHPLAALARATTAGDSAEARAAREEGGAALVAALDGPADTLLGLAPEAMIALARLDAASDDPDRLRRAALLLLRFVERSPGDERAGAALAGAAAAAEAAARDAGSPGDEPLLLRALRAVDASELPVPGQDALRLRLVAVLAADPTEQSALEAEAVLGRVGEPSLAARAALARSQVWGALLLHQRLGDEPIEPRVLHRTARRVLAAVDAATRARGPDRTPLQEAELAIEAADALLALGEPAEALQAVAPAGLLAHGARTTQLAARARAIGAEAYIELERAPEAAGLLREPGPLGDAARARVTTLAASIWRRLRPMTRGFPNVPAPEGPSPGELAMLRAASEVDPASVQGGADIAWAWGVLLTGAATEAARTFESIDRVAGARTAPDVLLGLGESHLARGDDAAAFDAFRRAATLAEAIDPASGELWHAWTRMLEILSRQNADRSRTPLIRRELARLRASGPVPPECGSRLDAVEQSLGAP